MQAVPSLLSNHDWEPRIDCRTLVLTVGPLVLEYEGKMDRDTAHQELMAKRRTEASKQVLILAACGVCSIAVCWALCQALGPGLLLLGPLTCSAASGISLLRC